MKNLKDFKKKSAEEVFTEKKKKFLRIGRSKGFINNLEDLSALKTKNNNFDQIFKFKKITSLVVGLGLIAIISLIIFL